MKRPKAKEYVGELVTIGDRQLQYQQIGFCPECLERIEALQPGGLEPRHVETKVEYGECLAYKQASK